MSVQADQAKTYFATEEVLYNGDMGEAPQGVKLICENPGGVAVFASINARNIDHFIGWAPMPKKMTQRNIISSLDLKIEQIKRMLKELGADHHVVDVATSQLQNQLKSIKAGVNPATPTKPNIDERGDRPTKKIARSASALTM